MSKKEILGGTVHALSGDLQKALARDAKALAVWQDLTPLARNEWICWTISVKKEETRHEHVTRVVSQLKEGKRRPCCWIGCIHRPDKSMSASVKWALSKRARNKISEEVKLKRYDNQKISKRRF